MVKNIKIKGNVGQVSETITNNNNQTKTIINTTSNKSPGEDGEPKKKTSALAKTIYTVLIGAIPVILLILDHLDAKEESLKCDLKLGSVIALNEDSFTPFDSERKDSPSFKLITKENERLIIEIRPYFSQESISTNKNLNNTRETIQLGKEKILSINNKTFSVRIIKDNNDYNDSLICVESRSVTKH